MLTREENEFLTRIGAGTPMGDLLRQYWHPVLLKSELPDPDCPPLRVRLLGEDLVAFRDSSGGTGLLANNCPHRGASLFFGRNEEDGLRCVYHGWKFDVAGRCVDMPNEPPESNFKQKVRQRAYPFREWGGLIWAYLGPLDPPPPLPEFEFALLPEENVYISKRWQHCNWVQAYEGAIDSSHSAFLHSTVAAHRAVPQALPQLAELRRGGSAGNLYKARDRHPHFEAVETDYGVLIGARRDADQDHYYWRTYHFLMPHHAMNSPYGEDPSQNLHTYVPMDDENTMTWSYTWHPRRALTEEELTRMKTYPGSGRHVGLNGLLPATSQPDGAWRPRATRENDYERDYEAEKTLRFCGVPNQGMQDQAVQESMGAIYDRTGEHLGVSDTGIIMARRRLLQAARALRDQGATPPGVQKPEAYRVRGPGVLLPKTAPWVETIKHLMVARPGSNVDAV